MHMINLNMFKGAQSMYLINAIRTTFLAHAAYLLMIGDVKYFLFLVMSLGLTFIPSICEKIFNFTMPSFLEEIIIVFIFCSQWLGSYFRFYDIFSWWDILLHTASGFIISYCAVIILYVFDREGTLLKSENYRFVALFTFIASTASACIWEIFEFTSDILLKTNTQHGSLQDTMTDMIVCVIGGLIFSLAIYISGKKGKKTSLVRHIEKFIVKNEGKLQQAEN